jgi:hypothetical protein
MGRNVNNGYVMYNFSVNWLLSCASVLFFSGQHLRGFCAANQTLWKEMLLLGALLFVMTHFCASVTKVLLLTLKRLSRFFVYLDLVSRCVLFID